MIPCVLSRWGGGGGHLSRNTTFTFLTCMCTLPTRAGLNVSIVGLERALVQYTSDPSCADKPFDLKTVPVDIAPMKDLPKQSKHCMDYQSCCL